MTTNRDGRLGRRTVEQLLDGRGGDERLAELLAAAASPAHATELTGEEHVLAQFRAAVPVTHVPARRRSMLETVLAKLLAAKVLAAVAASSLATGGVALAATTGSLPRPLQSAAHDAFGAPAPSRLVAAHADESTKDGRPGTAPWPTLSATASPTPSLVGLCQAFRAAMERDAANALDSPAFSVLVVRAGGRDAVAEYCTTLTGAAGTVPAESPTSTVHPTERPAPDDTGAPSDERTNAPRTYPTDRPVPTGSYPGYPTGYPSGSPTARPSDRPTGYPSGYPTGSATGEPATGSYTPRGR